MQTMELPGPDDMTERVRLEIIGLLTGTPEVDLGTLYRALMQMLGNEVVADIGQVIARLLRDGAIEIETRSVTPDGPHIGIVRLALPVHPPYAQLVA